ncbi:MAG: PAS domain-containing protein, partial [Caldilineaceae bacterium]|nr:PAS domain-containing protein [Caldilineaceae bacterium]
LADTATPRGKRLQIDTFFQSLAEHHGDGAAIILSGMGSDGAVGVQRIKERGGLILVQAPTEAEFDSMPRSAIASGVVDVIAPVAELAAQLVAAKRTRAHLALPGDPMQLSPATAETLTQLLNYLRHKRGHDFGGYRLGPLLQRIGRRMQLTGEPTLSGYLQRLRGDDAAVDLLFHDLVTHVTTFFHDQAAWARLEEEVIPQLFAGKGPDDRVRVWTVGCANGEEAYGVGMLLLEHAATLDRPPAIQIFASDLGKVALDFARAGVYPEAIAAHVAEERLDRFFAYRNHHYHVRQPLRDLVIFASHNLLQDPPFARLDLIICRDLLIYLQPQVQEQVYAVFHYALRPAPTPGYLFLGDRELRTIVRAQGESAPPDLFIGDGAPFVPIDQTARIYQRSPHNRWPWYHNSAPVRRAAQYANRRPAGNAPRESTHGDSASPDVIHGTMHRQLLEAMAPPSLLVDEGYNVLHLSETVGRYLRLPGGKLTSDITELVRSELQMGLRAALTQCFADGHRVHTQPVPVHFDGDQYLVSLLVQPSPEAGRAVVLFFEGHATAMVHLPLAQEAKTTETGEVQTATPMHVRRQLLELRGGYESMMQELQTANFELQSDSVEHLALVEELKSSKEELQTVNEELLRLNEALKDKVRAENIAYLDLENLYTGSDVAAIFLDRQLQVIRFTPHAVDLFNLIPADQGRPIRHLNINLYYDQLEHDAREVLRTLLPVERQIQSEAGRWFLLRVRPYRTPQDRIDGVVLTLVDITASKRNELALRDAKE